VHWIGRKSHLQAGSEMVRATIDASMFVTRTLGVEDGWHGARPDGRALSCVDLGGVFVRDRMSALPANDASPTRPYGQ
jgi:hypothetical protein